MQLKIVLALFACLAYQGVSGNVLIGSETLADAYGIAEEVQQALEKLKAVVDKAVTDAIDTFNDILDTILELAKGIVVSATDVIGEKAKEVIGKINEMVGNAESSGVDVAECVFGVNEKIASIPETLTKDMVRCIEDIIEKTKNIITQAIGDVNAVLGIVVKLEEAATDCGIGITAIPCLGKVMLEIAGETIQLPLTIGKHVAEVVVYVATVKVKLVQCESTAIATAGKELGDVLIGVAKCIQEKVQNQTESERLRLH